MTAILLHALGCANGAAMAALTPREIDTLSDAEITLAGEKIDDAQLVRLVGRMRHILAQLKR